MPEFLPFQLILQARERILPYVRRTPVVPSAALSDRLGAHVYVKQELFQKTGAFKVRGALNKALALSPEERRRGLVAVSGGNHAQGVAYAARVLNVRALIVMPESAPRHYVEATRGYGAEVRLAPTTAAAFAEAERLGREGWSFIHPFDDPLVMAGQATAGLELVEDCPTITDLVISIGGGGLMAGVAAAVKHEKPQVRIWGVETEGADCMWQSLAKGEIVTLSAVTSVAKTLGAPAPSPTTFAMAKEYLESVTVVPDAEAVEAMRFLLERLKLLTEPAASCTLAAAQRLRSHFSPSSHVVLFLCGGNMSVDEISRIHAQFPPVMSAAS